MIAFIMYFATFQEKMFLLCLLEKNLYNFLIFNN